MRIIPSAVVSVVTGFFVFSLAACQGSVTGNDENWPPVSSELHQEFRNNQQGLEVLSRALAESEYTSIVLWGDNAVRASKIDSEGYDRVDVEEPHVWKALFEEAGVDTATNFRDEISLHNRFEAAGTFDKTIYDYMFVRSDKLETPICIPRFSDAECGSCIEQIDNRWYLSLMWYPSDWLADFEGLGDADTEQYDELNKSMQLKMDACMNRFFDEL